MIKIARVEKNKCNFSRMDEFVPPLLHKSHLSADFDKLNDLLNDYIWSELKPYVTFIDVDINDPMTTICTEITKCFPGIPYDNFFYMTEGSYSSPKAYLEFVYALPTQTSYVKSQPENMNNFGCLMSLKHNVVENSCVVIANKYDLKAEKFVSLMSIRKEDLIRVIRRRYFHSAILIKDNNIIKYYYQNPGALASSVFNLDINTDSVETLSFTHLKYNLIYYFKQDKTKYPNQCATRINAHNKIYGDVLVFNELEENIFTNLGVREFKRLNLLSYGRLCDRELTTEETFSITGTPDQTDQSDHPDQSDTMPNKKDLLWSKYLVSEHRFSKLGQNKNQCIMCKNKIETRVICPHCFRPKYCSMECCIHDFSTYHFKECIYD